MLKNAFFIACFYFVSSHAYCQFEHFITRDGSRLLDGDRPFRFAGLHAPELHRIEDDERGVCKEDRRGWGQYFKWPTKEEQQNWVRSLVRTGHKATRIYVLSVAQPDDAACQREVHILPPVKADGMPRLNEKAMQVLDHLLATADEEGLRLIIPFIDHWSWWGGRAELAAFYDESADDFYDTKSKTYRAYQSIIQQVVTRTNTISGRKYSAEKAIMAWETGNELKDSTSAFVTETAALIRRFAPNQLVADGNYLSVLSSSVNDPNIDIISNHFYSVNHNNKPQTIIDDLVSIKGKKVYIIGEFGLLPTKQIQEIMQAAVTSDVNGAQASGALVWGFRGRRHNGGFYWHKEGNSDYYSYHLPGFEAGKENDEIAVIDTIRQAQANMNEEVKPRILPSPEPPTLRDVSQARHINWLGSPVARAYRIERKLASDKKWYVIAKEISDGKNQYDSRHDNLFTDTDELTVGQTYLYRVIGINESGESPPSNVQPLYISSKR